MALEIEYVGKNGEEIKKFDVSSEATSPFGFLYQDRVKTPNGDASVIGVGEEGKLWFHVDGDAGASHWSKCISAQDFINRGFIKIQAADDPLKLDPNEFHRLKKVTIGEKEVPLIMQNVNGPCPVIALANALILRGDLLKFVTDEKSTIVKSADLRSKLLEHIKRHSFHQYTVPMGAVKKFGSGESERDTLCGVEDLEEKMSELRTKIGESELKKFYQGIDVSPIFTNVDGFDYDKDAMTFALGGIRLCHGWLLGRDDNESGIEEEKDPAAPEGGATAAAPASSSAASQYKELRKYSYDDLMIVMTDPENPHSALAGEFLAESSSQLTEIGLQSLNNSLAEGEICVLFRNNHFSTLLKKGGVILIVVSDEGYADRSCVVFEELTLHGGGSFYDGDVYPVEEYVLSVVSECGNKFSDTDIRTAFAALLSESETGDLPSIPQIVKKLEKDHEDANAPQGGGVAGGGGGTQPAGRTSPVDVGTATANATTQGAVTQEAINDAVKQLASMGFDEQAAKSAMERCGSIEEAVMILTS